MDTDESSARPENATPRKSLSIFPSAPTDFQTIDWSFSASKELKLQRALKEKEEKKRQKDSDFMKPLYQSFESAQSWFLQAIVGILVGLLCGIIQIGAQWLFDMKFGSCVFGFWNNQRDCCIASFSSTTCTVFRPWPEILGFLHANYVVRFVTYVGIAMLTVISAAWLVVVWSPFASRSGLPEVKTILGGFVMRGFLGARTLLVKSISLVLVGGSGIGLDIETAFVHIACAIANISSRLFSKYKHNEMKRRELLSSATAAGISVAFGAPIGGVLFSLEQMSSYFPPKTMWRSFFAAIAAAITLSSVNPLRNGKIVKFEISYHYAWMWFELLPILALAVTGGLLGVALLKVSVRYARFRHRALIFEHPILEVGLFALLLSVARFNTELLHLNNTTLLEVLFADCKKKLPFLLTDLCVDANADSIFRVLSAVAFLKILVIVFVANTILPGGSIIPSMAFGACVGRVGTPPSPTAGRSPHPPHADVRLRPQPSSAALR